jgi:hypothetical protein
VLINLQLVVGPVQPELGVRSPMQSG